LATALEFKGLTKEYHTGFGKNKRLVALDKLDLTVGAGEIFGFLGPNGAGKTTSIKLSLGFIRPTAGSATIFGKDTRDWRVRERVGYLPENPAIYPYLTGRQALEIIGRIFSMDKAKINKRIGELKEQLGLGLELDLQIKKHSKGMVQRVGLAQALINDPELVILDEPMSGLDPIGRKMFRDVMLLLKSQGKTVFFSSHILSDIEMLCDRVAMLTRGCLVMDEPMSEMLEQQRAGGKSLEEIFMEKVGAPR
jgi:ABC-2 type transport system ATP-binding protein